MRIDKKHIIVFRLIGEPNDVKIGICKSRECKEGIFYNHKVYSPSEVYIVGNNSVIGPCNLNDLIKELCPEREKTGFSLRDIRRLERIYNKRISKWHHDMDEKVISYRKAKQEEEEYIDNLFTKKR